MRKFLSFLSLTLLFVACQNEPTEKSVDVKLCISAEDIITRTNGNAGYSSALGAIQNFTDEDWAKYDLRYTFAVYAAGNNGSGSPIANTRQVKTINRYNAEKEVYFNVSLVPNKTYKFVVFADFVNDGEASDLYYNAADLRNITAVSGKLNPMDEARDAYFATKEIAITTHLEESIYLKRPLGKLRVVTTDYDYVENYAVPARAKVTYYNCEVFKSLNAVNGTISTARSAEEMTYEYDLAKDGVYTAGLDADATKMTLFTDYLLAPREGQDEVNFKFVVWDANGKEINTKDFNIPIPVERNFLTTIVGNILTTQADIKVNINHELKEGETL